MVDGVVMMEFINEYAGCITVVILLIVAAVSYPSLIGGWFLAPFERKPKRIKKSRAQHEKELERMWDEELNFAPPTKAELRRWQKEDDATYNENERVCGLWHGGDEYISAEGHLVDAITNSVKEYNVAPRRK